MVDVDALADPERIWLQSAKHVDPAIGRQWCEDKVWPECEEDGEPVEYIRADVVARLLDEQREADARVAWKVADDIAHEARAESLDHRWFQDGREAGAREVLASIRGAQ